MKRNVQDTIVKNFSGINFGLQNISEHVDVSFGWSKSLGLRRSEGFVMPAVGRHPGSFRWSSKSRLDSGVRRNDGSESRLRVDL